ncbi:hypothetical protein H0H92_007733 [Tricholoma furcatifolium]|nr:hypothetical protein H0H92_007733 [Tricholoma furcatifolium]
MKPQPIFLDTKSDEPLALPVQSEPQPACRCKGRDRKCRKRGRRVWRFFSKLLFLWVAFVVVRDCIRYRMTRKGFKDFKGVNDTDVDIMDPMEWPIPPDVTLGECAQWEEVDGLVSMSRLFAKRNHQSVTNFELPVSSDALLFLARGRVTGKVKVKYGGDSEDVQVGVKAFYRFDQALESVQVCKITRGDGENGLGIFGPNWSRRNSVGFELTILLPQATEGSVLNVKAFETDMPLFVHDVDDLNGSVHFESIDLKTANVPISVKSLEAEKATVATANGAIVGEFHASSSLKLVTSNAPIDVQVTLFNDNEGSITDLDMTTANAAIKGSLSLEAPDDIGGNFKINAKTANAPLTLLFIDAPVDSVLNLDAFTAIAPAVVTLHHTYEGAFSATTSLRRPLIVVNRDVEDPAGKGRQRKVEQSVRGATVSGTVRWSDGDNDKELKGIMFIISLLDSYLLLWMDVLRFKTFYVASRQYSGHKTQVQK